MRCCVASVADYEQETPNKRVFKFLPCYQETPFKNICYNNLFFRLSLIRYKNIKFVHTKIIKTREMRAQETD